MVPYQFYQIYRTLEMAEVEKIRMFLLVPESRTDRWGVEIGKIFFLA
jgi:hypothetical protein